MEKENESGGEMHGQLRYTGRSSICGGRQKMILAQLAMDFR